MRKRESREIIMAAIRQAISDRGCTQGELAEATGIGQAHLSRVLSGKRTCTVGTADRMLSALGLEICESSEPSASTSASSRPKVRQ